MKQHSWKLDPDLFKTPEFTLFLIYHTVKRLATMVQYGFDNDGFLTYVRASQNSLKSRTQEVNYTNQKLLLNTNQSISIHPTPSLLPWVHGMEFNWSYLTVHGIWSSYVHESPHLVLHFSPLSLISILFSHWFSWAYIMKFPSICPAYVYLDIQVSLKNKWYCGQTALWFWLMPCYFLKSSSVDKSKYSLLLLGATSYSIIHNHHIWLIHSLSGERLCDLWLTSTTRDAEVIIVIRLLGEVWLK